MDDIDRRILSELGADARLPFRDLGARVGLSPNAAAARVRRLVDRGVIARFTVELGPAADGLARDAAPRGAGMEVFIDVRLKEGVTCDDFATSHRAFPEIVDAAHVTGPYDYLVHAVGAGRRGSGPAGAAAQDGGRGRADLDAAGDPDAGGALTA